jgi:hypothetical protein
VQDAADGACRQRLAVHQRAIAVENDAVDTHGNDPGLKGDGLIVPGVM